MAYDKDSNRLTGRDFKDGDYMYIQYAFTNTQCGTTGNACAPPRSDRDVHPAQAVQRRHTAGHLLELEADDGLSRLVAGPA
jgi:hypothetical protein